eukprot:CAMPEP_0118664390 /NCGR_PEP_ID=MMETSP0785-20121206/17987_1 /TAXON_ID=91992 /ORGANISM="Bolidomonas pacifica, Strain CCMP 1866" /LENGTH=119 /DNA_ID=CAMNT_0006558293 /DNA_START=462 /DNA_END=819 /DNA_ORIENTATION=-
MRKLHPIRTLNHPPNRPIILRSLYLIPPPNLNPPQSLFLHKPNFRYDPALPYVTGGEGLKVACKYLLSNGLRAVVVVEFVGGSEGIDGNDGNDVKDGNDEDVERNYDGGLLSKEDVEGF